VRFQFGAFTVDDDARQVLRGGHAVHLSPKAFDLLATLIRERPRVLAKADLHAQLWPKTFVSDASLAMLVAEVRAALGENARQAGCVRTVHRHGYAFQAPVREVSEGAQAGIGYWLVTPSRQIALAPGDNIVGRDPGARVWLDAPGVSRRHACIHVEQDRVTLEDLGSKNNTHANGVRVNTMMALEDGADLCFGSVKVTFRAWSADPTRSEADS
jgi:DNA-binding winged helix-turn-helix (wHTH) protein